MTTVKASCPDCGDIETHTGEVSIVTYKYNLGENHQYYFRCPVCRTIVTKEAPSRIVELLIKNNCPQRIIAEPKIDFGYGSPVDENEVIDFYELVQDEEKFDSALAEFIAEP